MLRVIGIKKTKWDLVIKVVFFCVFAAVLYYQLIYSQNFDALTAEFLGRLQSGNVLLLILVLLLMPVNWLLEALKWRLLLRKSLRIRISDAIRGVMAGLSFSMLTPNRIGEYFGRIVHINPEHNWNAALSTLAGSISQNLVNVTVGMFACIYILKASFLGNGILFGGVLSGALILSAVLVFLYYRMDLLSMIANAVKLPFFKPRWKEKFAYFRTLDQDQLSGALRLSAVRYGIFCTQYVMMLQFFGVGISPILLFAGVAVIYLMHTSVPLPPFIDQMARAQLALLLWTNSGENELSLLSAGFFIWIINVVVPAFFGVISIGNVRLLKSFGYETE